MAGVDGPLASRFVLRMAGSRQEDWQFAVCSLRFAVCSLQLAVGGWHLAFGIWPKPEGESD